MWKRYGSLWLRAKVSLAIAALIALGLCVSLMSQSYSFYTFFNLFLHTFAGALLGSALLASIALGAIASDIKDEDLIIISQKELDRGFVYKRLDVAPLPQYPLAFASESSEQYLVLVEYPHLGRRFVALNCNPPPYFTQALEDTRIIAALPPLSEELEEDESEEEDTVQSSSS